jgi:fumarate reductase subunit D
LGLAGSLILYFRNGDWPKFPLLQFVAAVWWSALIIPVLASGRASVGSVSFTRAEEPREYWVLFAGGVLFLILMWVTILLKVGVR